VTSRRGRSRAEGDTAGPRAYWTRAAAVPWVLLLEGLLISACNEVIPPEPSGARIPSAIRLVSCGEHTLERCLDFDAEYSTQLTVEILDQDDRGIRIGHGADVSVTWISSDTGVVTVDSLGWVTAVGRGTARVTGSFDDLDLDISAVVGWAAPTSVDVFGDDYLAVAHPHGQAYAAVYGAGGPETVSWRSTDTTVVTVEHDELSSYESNVIRIEGPGVAHIVASIGELADSFPLLVEPWADLGRIVYVDEPHPSQPPQLYVMEVATWNRHAIANSQVYPADPAWSPDGERIVLLGKTPAAPGCEDTDPSTFGCWYADIYVIRRNGSGKINLTKNSDLSDLVSSPAWSPDGSRIAFLSWPAEIHLIDPDGENRTALIGVGDESGSSFRDLAWLPDGEWLSVTYSPPYSTGLCSDILLFRIDGSAEVNLTDHEACDSRAAWSPDGSRVAFISDRSGTPQLHLMDPDGGNVTEVTTAPAGWVSGPISWSPDGTKILVGSWSVALVRTDWPEDAAYGAFCAWLAHCPPLMYLFGGRDPAWWSVWGGFGSGSRRDVTGSL